MSSPASPATPPASERLTATNQVAVRTRRRSNRRDHVASYQYLLDEHVFQSSPTWSGGCNRPQQDHEAGGLGCFNPHPPGRVGATCSYQQHSHPQLPCFNPHPPGRVGATAKPSFFSSAHFSFQSSPTWSGGCNLLQPSGCSGAGGVSILTHLVGWVQPEGTAHR